MATQLQAESSTPSASTKTDALAVGIAVFALLTIVQRFVGFGRSLAFCHLMTDAELGRWSLSMSFLMLAGPLAVLGLPGTFTRYFEHFRARGQVHGYLRRVLRTSACLMAVFVAAVLIWPAKVSYCLLGSAQHATLVQSLAVALVVVAIMNVGTELAVAMRQVRLVSVMQFMHSILFAIIACVLLLTTRLADQGVVIAYAAAAAITMVVMLVILRSRIRSMEPDTQSLDRSVWAKLVPFAAWMWAGNLLFNLFETADRLMIVHLADAPISSDALVGQYHASRVIPVLLVALAGALGSVTLPYMSEDWERGDRHKVSATTLLTLKICSLVFVSCGACLLLFAPLVFGILLQGRYDAGLQILPGTLLYCTWFGLASLTQNHLLCAERAKWISVALGVGLIANVVLNAMLLPWLGLVGAVTATAIANAVTFCFTLRFAQHYGLQVDRQIWLIAALPLVLLCGWLASFTVLAILLWMILRGDWILSAEERAQVLAGWNRCTQRFRTA